MGIAQAILRLRADYAKQENLSPYQINSGRCDEFAETLKMTGFGIAVWGSQISIENWSPFVQDVVEAGCLENFDYFADCHCLTFYHGKYYDSECSQGCEYPDQLPIYQRNLEYYEVFA